MSITPPSSLSPTPPAALHGALLLHGRRAGPGEVPRALAAGTHACHSLSIMYIMYIPSMYTYMCVNNSTSPSNNPPTHTPGVPGVGHPQAPRLPPAPLPPAGRGGHGPRLPHRVGRGQWGREGVRLVFFTLSVHMYVYTCIYTKHHQDLNPSPPPPPPTHTHKHTTTPINTITKITRPWPA